jgi:hypothetical protein
MKRYVLLLLILAEVFLTSCSASKQSIPEKGFIGGTIYSIGNDPFTKLGLQTEDGTMYILQCPREIESELHANQGKILKVQYDGIQQSPEGQTLRVVKIIKPN